MTRVLVAASSLLVASACCPPASRCASNGAVVIRVLNAETGAPLTSATVLASSGGGAETEVPQCRLEAPPDGGVTNCRAIVEPGTYRVTVRAPGFLETSLDVAATRDACGDVKAQEREIKLQPVGSAQQPLVDARETCGG